MLVKNKLGLQIFLPRVVITGQSHQALGIELPVFHLALYQLKYDRHPLYSRYYQI